MTETTAPTPLGFIAGQSWPLLVFRGVLAILLGLCALFVPLATAATVAIVVGIFSIVDGIVEIVAGTRQPKGSKALPILAGAVDVIFGILIASLPLAGLITVVLIIGFWAVVIGVVRAIGAVTGRKADPGGWGWSLVWGVLTVIFGIVVLTAPGGALLVLIYTVGIWALIIGITLIVAGVRVRKVAKTA